MNKPQKIILKFLLLSTAMVCANAYTISLNKQKEIWITPGTSGSGNGSYATPFEVANASDFDSLMRDSISAGVKKFNLTSGTFYTEGWPQSSTWVLPAESTFLGDSPNSTVLIRTLTNSSADVMIKASGDHITIKNLTINCNGTSTQSKRIEAIEFGGSYCSAFNVVVEKPTGQYKENVISQECFVFSVTSPSSGPWATGNSFEKCVVTNVVTPTTSGYILYLNGFAPNGSAICRDCKVYLPKSPRGGVGFNLQAGRHQLYENCYVEGGLTGFYGDSGSCKDISILHSTLSDIYDGIKVHFGESGFTADTFIILGNIFEYDPMLGGLPSGIFIEGIGTPSLASNFKISNNTFRYIANQMPTSGVYVETVRVGDFTDSMVNITAFNNTMAPYPHMRMYQGGSGITDSSPGHSTLYLLNRDIDGNMPRFYNHKLPPPSKHHLITSSTDVIASDDAFVTVKLSTSGTFQLPSSAGQHHTITVYNDQGVNSNTVTITPATGSPNIEPGNLTSYVIAPNQSARFFYDGFGIWKRN
jgi:hypothetical protein